MDKSKVEEHMANEEVLTDEQKAAVQQLQRESGLLANSRKKINPSTSSCALSKGQLT